VNARQWQCVFLPRQADHSHHVTGRNVAGQYLDPELVVPVCQRQHVVEHQGWRIASIGEDSQLPDNLLRLRRTAHLLVRLAKHHEIGFVVLPASVVQALGRVLQRIADEMDGGQ
jgi:hypothetical protein